MSQVAYFPYARGNVPAPSGDAATDTDALRDYINNELGFIQSAIPIRTTRTYTQGTSPTSAATLTVADDVLRVDCTAGGVTVTFPDPTQVANGEWTVKKIDSSGNAVTFAATIRSSGAAATFDGAASPTLAAQWNTKKVRSNGTSYDILSSF